MKLSTLRAKQNTMEVKRSSSSKHNELTSKAVQFLASSQGEVIVMNNIFTAYVPKNKQPRPTLMSKP